ncbi:hypothetical protein KCV06_g624, partial [Aureobasidium melanogenum]
MDRCPDPRNPETALVNEALGRTRKCVSEPYHIAEREQARKKRKQKSRIILSTVGGKSGSGGVAMSVSVGEARHECKNLRAASGRSHEARPCNRRLRLQRGSKEAGTT